MGDVQNNIEDEKQARSKVCLRGGAIQHGDGPERVWRGKSLGRGELCLSEDELHSNFAIGGAHFKCISVSQLGGSRPSEMAGNAFKTNMVW